jgi:hypothetical protein
MSRGRIDGAPVPHPALQSCREDTVAQAEGSRRGQKRAVAWLMLKHFVFAREDEPGQDGSAASPPVGKKLSNGT